MARSISVTDDNTDVWRAVLVWKDINGELLYSYEGLYANKGTAKARVTFWRNTRRHFLIYPGFNKGGRYVDFYDGWVESGDITWNKVKD